MPETLTQSALDQFMGTEQWYHLSPLHGCVICTEGVKYMADAGEAYWLIDVIASYQLDAKINRERFQVWQFKKNEEGDGAVVTCEDGDFNRIVVQEFSFTTFPLNELKLYLEDSQGPAGRVKVLMLPGER